MKKRVLSIAILILISASGGFAQTVEQQAAKIRSLYAAANKRIDEGLKDKTSGLHYAARTIGGERDGQQWAAVGTMKKLDEFWFDGELEFNEEEKPDARKMIRKIVSLYASAADLRTRSEYLFDAETSELVFAFTTELGTGGKTIERRFYFHKGKLIRVARDGKNVDANFSAADLNAAQTESDAAKRLKNLFALMMAE
ncbi:MAG TPA: hypothetical protein VGB00_10045 [Pyrinomonadaceae bacterium]|jgi:hypothetical protein